MNDKNGIITDGIVGAFSVMFSISDIESTISIIILVIQCVYILYRIIFNIYLTTKGKSTKEYDWSDTDTLINTLKDTLNILINKENKTEEDKTKIHDLEETIQKLENKEVNNGNK